jgi:hypothetical protein
MSARDVGQVGIRISHDWIAGPRRRSLCQDSAIILFEPEIAWNEIAPDWPILGGNPGRWRSIHPGGADPW